MRYDVGRFRRPMRRSTEGQLMSLISLGDGSTLTLDFTTGVLDPRLTFTRAANTATVINSSGLVQTVNADVPRFDHDPTTLAPRGLLIEGTATNLVLYSQSFTSGISWFFGGTGTKSTTNNYATAPDGTTTAARLQLGQNCAIKQIAGTTGVNHIVSIWVKSNTGSNQTIAFWTGTAAANRTATTSWTRIEAVVNNASAALFDLYNPNASDCDILIWGAQLETGSGASSYIPTGASQVQRLADNCVTAIGNLTGFDANQGTIYESWRDNTASDTTTVQEWAFAFGTSAAAGCGVFVSNAASGTFGVNGGVSNVGDAGPAGTYVIQGVNKAAIAINVATTSLRLSANGSAVSAGTNISGYNGAQTFALGQRNNNSRYLNGWIRQFKYWPYVLSDAQLQALTTL